MWAPLLRSPTWTHPPKPEGVDRQQRHLHLAGAQSQGIRNSKRLQMMGHCPSACHRGSLGGGKKAEDFIEGGGVGWELGRSKERQRVSSPPPPVTPVPPSVGVHVGTHKGRWMNLVCLQMVPYLPSASVGDRWHCCFDLCRLQQLFFKRSIELALK